MKISFDCAATSAMPPTAAATATASAAALMRNAGFITNPLPRRPRHADEERAHRERRELGMQRTNSDHLRGNVHVARGHPRAPDRSTREVARDEREDADDREHQEILLHGRLDRVTEDRERRRGYGARR